MVQELENIPLQALENDIANLLEWNSSNELSDDKLLESEIGQRLASLNVQVLAFIERPFYGVIIGNHIRCSLLLDHQ